MRKINHATLSIFLLAFVLLSGLEAQNPTSSSGTVQQTYKVDEPVKRQSASAKPRFELTPIAGYALNGHVNIYNGKIKMDNAAQYGGILSVELKPGMLGEFSYTRSKTTAHVDKIVGDLMKYDMSVDYFQLGGVKELTQGPLVPFGMASLGLTWFNMRSHDVSDHVSFSVALGGGLKYFFNDRLGIRLQGRLLMPMYFSGGGLFLGIGSDGPSSGVSVNTGFLTVQGDFSGGLIFRF